MNHKDRAKRLLMNYFTVLGSKLGIVWEYENIAEIEEIIDSIIAAAKQEIRQDREDENAGSYGEYRYRYNRKP